MYVDVSCEGHFVTQKSGEVEGISIQPWNSRTKICFSYSLFAAMGC